MENKELLTCYARILLGHTNQNATVLGISASVPSRGTTFLQLSRPAGLMSRDAIEVQTNSVDVADAVMNRIYAASESEEKMLKRFHGWLEMNGFCGVVEDETIFTVSYVESAALVQRIKSLNLVPRYQLASSVSLTTLLRHYQIYNRAYDCLVSTAELPKDATKAVSSHLSELRFLDRGLQEQILALPDLR